MLFAEMFPVNEDRIPTLYAYEVQSGGDTDIHSLGGKLSFKLQAAYGGCWAWVRSDLRLVSDKQITESEVKKVIQSLWETDDEFYKDLHFVLLDTLWETSASAMAAYTTRRISDQLSKKMNQKLVEYDEKLGNVIIQRTFKPRGWVVSGKPAISISVSSNLFYRQDLATLYSSEPGIRLENLFVKDKHSNLKGEIVAVAGQVRDHRARLLALSSSETSRKTIAAANDADLVLRVRTRNRKVYDYVIGALDIVVRTMDFERFNVDGRKALSLMKLAPQKRWKIVEDLANLVQAEGLIGKELTEESLELGFTRFDYADKRRILFGDGSSDNYNEKAILSNLRSRKMFHIADKYNSNKQVQIGIVIDNEAKPLEFLLLFQNELRKLGFEPKSVDTIRLDNFRRETIEKAFASLRDKGSDVILAIFPEISELDDEDDPYTFLKAIAVKHGMPS